MLTYKQLTSQYLKYINFKISDISTTLLFFLNNIFVSISEILTKVNLVCFKIIIYYKM